MNSKNFMMLVLLVSLVIVTMLTSGCLTSDSTNIMPITPSQKIENITPTEAFTLIQDNEDNPNFVILDVRTPEEFSSGHIENSINLDFFSETFRENLDELDKNKTYLIYCKSGGRSGSALNIMTELNFMEVYNMLGGIISWEEEGLPTIM